MKRLVSLVTIVLLVFCQMVMAAPAKRGVYKTLKLDDGREIRAMLVGDEHGRFWKGDDGQAYVLRGDRYAVVDKKTIVERANARRAMASERQTKRLPKNRAVGDFKPYYGKKKSIVILVNFADIAFQEGHDNALVQRIMNKENFREDPYVGSVADYFRDQSNGQFELQFDVYGPVTLSKKRAYYGGNDNYGQDSHPAEMVAEAVDLMKDMVPDWHQYDWDGDGYVDQVFLIYAGNSEEDIGIEETIWAHHYYLYYAAYYGDGPGPVKVDKNLLVDCYACSSELNGDNSLFGIGPMCHEFSHCLGLPDFYDTSYSGAQGMNLWDLMADGAYLINGYHPAGYTSYERWKLGWLEPIVLENSDTTITDMKSLQEGGESYIIYNKGHRKEYFLLENRQFRKWDECLPAQGMLILHVDENAYSWHYNTVNDDYYHQRMTWVPADGLYQISFYYDSCEFFWYGLKTDPFPQDGVTAFNRSFMTYDSQAGRAARLFNRNIDGTYYIDSSVENITQNADGTISFRFVAAYMGEEPADPPKTINIDGLSGYCNVLDGTTLAGKTSSAKLAIEDGATVTLDGVTILGEDKESLLYPGIACKGDVTIILASGSENIVRGWNVDYPGIHVPKGKTLTIRGDGKLTASSNGYGAGIGGGVYINCGNIRIEGGTIIAQGGMGAAGIGGGYGASCGDITITTGVTSVTASTDGYANSIGAGYGDAETPSSCGKVTIGGVETGSIKTNPFVYTPTGIKSVTTATSSGPWYMLDGRRLNGTPSRKGLYINNGKKMVIR